MRFHSSLFVVVLSLILVSCGDDNGPDPDGSADSAPLDAGVDGGQDTGQDLTPDGTTTGCNPAVVGTPCTQGGSECGEGHTCLMVSASQGFCSCSCTEDDPVSVFMEDDCPGDDLVCSSFTPSGGTSKEPYCFVAVGAGKPATSSWYTGQSAGATIRFASHRVPPTTPFTVLQLRYRLRGSIKYCDTNMPHNVDLVASTSETPDPSPTPAASFAIPAGITAGTRMVLLDLSAPLTLNSGDHAFVIIDLEYDTVADQGICLMTHPGGSTVNSFIAEESTPPYTWQSSTSNGDLMLLGF
jgi:hypothetical protein